MATNARNWRLETADKQHAVVDDLRGVVLDVAVTTGEVNEGQVIVQRIDAAIDAHVVDGRHRYCRCRLCVC